jgi:hypothetical protein
MDARLKPEAARDMEKRWEAERRALELFQIVVAEWETDPTSVVCFDLRVVSEAKEVARTLRENKGIF